MRIFRSHTEVPVVANPTLAGLAREWVAINTAAEYHRQVAKLHIDGCLTPGAIVDAIDRSATDYATRDQLLLTLINADGYLPQRILLQAFLPKLLAQASCHANADDLDTRLQDRIVEFLENVANYPGHITKNVPMELLRRPRWRRTDGTHGYGHEPDLEGHLTLAEELTPEGHDADEDSSEKLEALFADAVSTGMCSPEELELLREFHLDGFSSTAVAERHGLSAAAVRQRVKRTRDRLAEVGRASVLVA